MKTIRSHCRSHIAETQPAVRRRVLPSILLGCLWFSACDAGPRAPDLRDTPVYHNKQAGFRFLVPDGWTQTTNAALPPGPIPGEVWVARYTLQTPERGATLQILCHEESLHPDPAKFHAEASFSVDQWKLATPAEPVTVSGVTGTRLVYSGTFQNRELTKEVVVFVRSGRVYCFVAVFQARDDQAREQVRRAISSLMWDA